MKKLVLIGLFISVSALFSQITLAEINTSTPETTNSKELNQNSSSWLGVWIEPVPLSLNQHFSSLIKENQGLIVKKVSPDSPADKAGLKPYDIITKFNDQEIFSEQQMVNLIRSTQPQTRVKLSIIRQGKLLHQEVTTEVSPNQNKTIKQSPRYLSPRQDMNMRPLSPPPWMNDPFFKHGFNQDFLDQKFDSIQQQMNQNQQSIKQRFNFHNGWSQFETVQMQSTGNDQHRAEVKYADSDGNKKEFVFEGTMNEIREQIMAQEAMHEDKKQSLLQALDINNMPPQNYLFRPDRFNQPLLMPHWFRN